MIIIIIITFLCIVNQNNWVWNAIVFVLAVSTSNFVNLTIYTIFKLKKTVIGIQRITIYKNKTKKLKEA